MLELNKIYNMDCLEGMKQLDDDSVDSVVTDPPAGISFMGKEWDDKGNLIGFQNFIMEVFKETFRVLKPGAYGLVWAIPRTSHHTAMGLERAGFEIRDVITHLFGTGFPKSLNINKQLKKMNTDDVQWEGWGTALKPASEHWILIRKPLSEKNVALNVLKWGTGGINIDESRIGNEKRINKGISKNKPDGAGTFRDDNWIPKDVENIAIGRFPSNVILDEVSAEMLNKQSGISKSNPKPRNRKAKGMWNNLLSNNPEEYSDKGGASRFFYVAKPSKKERNAGLDGFEEKKIVTFATANGTSGKPSSISEGRNTIYKNIHPTVKSITLMKYLTKLVTPKNGIIIDPFIGSGTTAIASYLQGFKFIGFEKEKEYFEIANARIKHYMKQDNLKQWF